jgi:hypothetical protein
MSHQPRHRSKRPASRQHGPVIPWCPLFVLCRACAVTSGCPVQVATRGSSPSAPALRGLWTVSLSPVEPCAGTQLSRRSAIPYRSGAAGSARWVPQALTSQQCGLLGFTGHSVSTYAQRHKGHRNPDRRRLLRGRRNWGKLRPVLVIASHGIWSSRAGLHVSSPDPWPDLSGRREPEILAAASPSTECRSDPRYWYQCC